MIRLDGVSTRDEQAAEKAKAIEHKTVAASKRQNVGDVEIDVDAERRENRANRDRPTRG